MNTFNYMSIIYAKLCILFEYAYKYLHIGPAHYIENVLHGVEQSDIDVLISLLIYVTD